MLSGIVSWKIISWIIRGGTGFRKSGASLFVFCIILTLVGPALKAQTPSGPAAPGTQAEAGAGDGSPDGETDENNNDDDAEKNKKKAGERFRPYFSLGADMIFFIEDSSLESDPEPILPALYFSFGFPVFQKNSIAVYVVPAFDIYWTHYRWSDARSRPVPAAIENRDEFVTGFITGLGAEGQMRLSKSFSIRLNLGLSADLRVILLADGLNPDVDPIAKINEEKEKVIDYFWKPANFLFAHIAFGFDFRISANYTVGLNIKTWIPFAAPKHYAGDSSLLGWRFGVLINFSRLIGTAAESAPASKDSETEPASDAAQEGAVADQYS
jgi:hypothetical protein